MRQSLAVAGLGLLAWIVGTLFFRLFGDWVLGDPAEGRFGPSLFLLEALTLLLVLGIALLLRLRLFPRRGSAAQFGLYATVISVLLDAYALWNRDRVYPDFSEGQTDGFVVYLLISYAILLVVPNVVDKVLREKRPIPETGKDMDLSAGSDDERTDSSVQSGN